MPLSERIETAFDLAYAAPVRLGRIAVLLVARDLTGTAADAFGHVEVKAILLVFAEGTIRDQVRTEGGDDVRGLEGLAEVCKRHAYEGFAAAVVCAFVQW